MSISNAPPASFLEASEAMGIAFDEGDLERLGHWLDLLRASNERMNLTRILEPEQMWHRHVLDSLSLLPFLESAGASSMLDIGSGGGAPGFPIAIALPQLRVGMVESVGKKARFLEETAQALGLENVRVFNDRAEQLGAVGSPERESWDAVSARAVGRLPVLLELTVPFVRIGGLVLAIKGEQAPVEIEEARGALHALHARVVDTHRTSTGTIVLIEKARKTPRGFPRRPGEPSREPLSH